MPSPGRADSYVDVVWDSDNLRRRVAQLEADIPKAARSAVAEITREAEQALEAATRAAVGGKLWRAWKSEVFPKTGLAENPAGIVFPNGRDRTKGAITAYARGANIRARQGQFLAIPLPAAGQRFSGRGKVPLTPGEWERRTGRILRLVYRRGKPSLLVADDATIGRSGFARAATARRTAQGRGVSTVPIFVLLPQVNVAQRFSIESTLAPFDDRLKRAFVERVRQLGSVNG
jgi:hypothetical protein